MPKAILELEMPENCGECPLQAISTYGKYGPETYCRLDGKRRFSTEGKGCLGWKERKQ